MTLELYLGPMYAGKTTKMIRMFRANPNAHKVSIDFNTETTHESEGRKPLTLEHISNRFGALLAYFLVCFN